MIESHAWQARTTNGQPFIMVCGESGPEEYLQVGDTLYRLVWKQDKMKECEYRLCEQVKTDTAPSPT